MIIYTFLFKSDYLSNFIKMYFYYLNYYIIITYFSIFKYFIQPTFLFNQMFLLILKDFW